MSNILYQHSATGHWPMCLYTAGHSTLLYKESSLTIRWLDCSSSTPKPDGELVTEQDYLFDMCCTEYEGKSLVVTTDGFIRCYNRESGELVWKVKKKLSTICNFVLSS